MYVLDSLEGLSDDEVGDPVDGATEAHGVGAGALRKQLGRNEPRNGAGTNGEAHDEENHEDHDGVPTSGTTASLAMEERRCEWRKAEGMDKKSGR